MLKYKKKDRYSAEECLNHKFFKKEPETGKKIPLIEPNWNLKKFNVYKD